MKKISDSLSDLVEQNSFLRFGLQHRLLNLSQVARYLKPQIEARTEKDIESSALTMNLSRLQREFSRQSASGPESLKISNLILQPELCVLAFSKTKELHASLNKLYNRVQRGNGYITISEGISEVAIITDQRFLTIAEELIGQQPFYKYSSVAALGVRFDMAHLGTPGLFYFIFQQFYFQRINILEIASAATELIIYIEEKNVRLAFDTLYNVFRPKLQSDSR
jgi:hypothetical protein